MRYARLPALSPIILLLLTICSVPHAHAQQMQAPTYFPPSATIPHPNTNTGPDLGPLGRRMVERMARERRTQLQKKMVTESNQLLALAQKLNAELASAPGTQATASAFKEAQKIEKLAKSIRTAMSYGY
jgi:hypothetical protein